MTPSEKKTNNSIITKTKIKTGQQKQIKCKKQTKINIPACMLNFFLLRQIIP